MATDGDRDAAQELWVELGKPEDASPTPDQLLAFMRRCPDSVGLDLSNRMIRSAEQASRCFVADHDGLLDELRSTHQSLADARQKLDAVNAWLDQQ